MFTPVRRDLFRWGTPDPESDWMMFGHVLCRDNGNILFDPPLIPGLLEAISRLGKLQAVVLTTLDHSRAAAHIVKKTGATLYLPDQQPSDVSPYALHIQEDVTDFQRYHEGDILGMKAFRLRVKENHAIGMPSMNEFAILTDHKELIVGDFVTGSKDGRILVAPEWFPSDTPNKPYNEARNEFKKLVENTGASALITSHGHCLFQGLQEASRKI